MELCTTVRWRDYQPCQRLWSNKNTKVSNQFYKSSAWEPANKVREWRFCKTLANIMECVCVCVESSTTNKLCNGHHQIVGAVFWLWSEWCLHELNRRVAIKSSVQTTNRKRHKSWALAGLPTKRFGVQCLLISWFFSVFFVHLSLVYIAFRVLYYRIFWALHQLQDLDQGSSIVKSVNCVALIELLKKMFCIELS